jgi:hypothetical protein
MIGSLVKYIHYPDPDDRRITNEYWGIVIDKCDSTDQGFSGGDHEVKVRWLTPNADGHYGINWWFSNRLEWADPTKLQQEQRA